MEAMVEKFCKKYLDRYGIPRETFKFEYINRYYDAYVSASCCKIIVNISHRTVTIYGIYGYLSLEGCSSNERARDVFQNIAEILAASRQIAELENEVTAIRAENAELRLLPDAPDYLAAKAHFDKLVN